MMNKEILKYLKQCGVRTHLKGFMYLYNAIETTRDNGGTLSPVTKIVYPEIAKRYNDTPTRVERAMRHAIQTSSKEYRTMSNSEFISNAIIELTILGE